MGFLWKKQLNKSISLGVQLRMDEMLEQPNQDLSYGAHNFPNLKYAYIHLLVIKIFSFPQKNVVNISSSW